MERLRDGSGRKPSTIRELERHAGDFLDVVAIAAGDRWSQALGRHFEDFCAGRSTIPRTGRLPNATPGARNVRRWGAVGVVRVARDLGVLAPEGELVLLADPPAVVDPIRELPDDDPRRIRQALSEYRPRTDSEDEEARVQEFLPTIQEVTLATNPRTAPAATTTAKCVTELMLWADDEMDTTAPADILRPPNVEAFIHDPAHDWTTAWRRTMRSVLRNVGRAVCPELWPDEPTIIGHTSAPLPYDAVDEHLLREAALMEGCAARCERLWLTAATIGGGLSAADAFRTGPDGIVNLDGGRLGVAVQRDRERIVPIREQYTDLVAEARELCDQPAFFDTTSKARAYNRAAKIRVGGLGRLLIPRARATFVCAHIRGGTALANLNEFAGPISAAYLQHMLGHCAESVDPLEAANRSLGA